MMTAVKNTAGLAMSSFKEKVDVDVADDDVVEVRGGARPTPELKRGMLKPIVVDGDA